jgi:tetratricopeptide (TPR) repeat protein
LLPRSISHLTVCAGLIAALASAPPPARAAGADDAARQMMARTLFDEGLEYSDAGRWQEAADRFRRAYQAKPTAEIAYNLAQAYVRLGYLSGAADMFRRAAVDPEASPPVREAARARLAQVTPRLGRLSVRLDSHEEAVVSVDGQTLERQQLGVPMPVDPGPHLVQARFGDGVDLSRRVTVAEGAESTVNLAPPTAAPQARRGLLRRGWFWVAVAGVAAGTATALVIAQGRSDPSGNVGTWHIDR